MGYDFRLYTYGPFDLDVLDDLEAAVLPGAARQNRVSFLPATVTVKVRARPRPSRNALPIGWRPTDPISPRRQRNEFRLYERCLHFSCKTRGSRLTTSYAVN